jgi:hypothetical protein
MLYGNLDGVTGNSKPKYANTTSVFGVSVTEAANTLGDGKKVAHAGWVQQTIGTGPIASITITSGGSGINASGFLSVSAVTGAGSANANISYFIANSQNTLQSFSTNPAWNVVTRVVVNSPGAGYSDVPTVLYLGANTTRPTFAVTLGGRAGRRSYETLVAMGSMTGDNPADNTYFPGA